MYDYYNCPFPFAHQCSGLSYPVVPHCCFDCSPQASGFKFPGGLANKLLHSASFPFHKQSLSFNDIHSTSPPAFFRKGTAMPGKHLHFVYGKAAFAPLQPVT